MNRRAALVFILATLFFSSIAWMVAVKTHVDGTQVAHLDSLVSEERRIVVVVNGNDPTQLEGLLKQKYSRFSVHALIDGERCRGELPRKYLLREESLGKRSFEEGLYDVVQNLPDNTLVIALDKGELPGSATSLSMVNKYFASNDIWTTVGGPGMSFLAGAFKNIPLGALLSHMEFASKAHVDALVSVSKERAFALPESLFEGEVYVGKKRDIKETSPRAEKPQCDLVVCSYNRPLQLMALIESSEKRLSGLGNIFVLYRSDEEYQQGYDKLIRQMPHVTFVKQVDPKKDFQDLFLDIVYNKSKSSHVLFGVDDIVVKTEVQIDEALREMEKTHAHGVFLRLGENITYSYMQDKPEAIPPSKKVGAGLKAFRFEDGQLDWKYPNTLDMTIYKKADIEKGLRSSTYKNPSELETFWNETSKFDFLERKKDEERNVHTIGLYYPVSKVVNIPMNVVTRYYENKNLSSHSPEELLRLFEEGYKIDVDKVSSIEHNSCHADIDLDFVQ